MPTLGDNLHLSKPVIAAVNGVAIAGGWVIAQMCDLCIAADTAKFGITEPKVGRGVAWSPPMVHMIGSRLALELMLTGRTIGAARVQIGFVNEVVPRAELIDAALAMAADIIECAPLSVVAVRQVVRHTMNMGLDAALEVGQAGLRAAVRERRREGRRARLQGETQTPVERQIGMVEFKTTDTKT